MNDEYSIALFDRAQSMGRNENSSPFVLRPVVEESVLYLREDEESRGWIQSGKENKVTNRSLMGSSADVASSRSRMVGF